MSGSHRFYVPVGMVPLTVPPADPEIGETYFDLVLGELRAYDGVKWVAAAPGAVGPTGPVGGPGPAGVRGATGPTGSVGATGPAGGPGPTGPQGVQGVTGDDGPAGVKGDTGPRGPAGAAGAQGVVGPTGPQGDRGGQGVPGVAGPVGPTGATGATGAAGAKGDTGQKGDPGVQGIQGPVGPQGLKGDTGQQGPQGPEGEQGTSIRLLGSVADNAGLPSTGNTVGDGYINQGDGNLWMWDGSRWVDVGQIVGPQGPQGVQGSIGPQGPQGVPGPQGVQGNAGPTGPAGAVGPTGTTGLVGPTGPTGPRGADGDASGATESIRSWVQSRGSGDLISNGTGYLGSNYNFTSFIFAADDSPPGASGSFYRTDGSYTAETDEFVPVVASNTYEYTVWTRQRNPATASTDGYMYIGHTCYDQAKQTIRPDMVNWLPGTSTRLAADLRPGDTVVRVESVNGWRTGSTPDHFYSIVFWNWKDSFGKVWPAGTYSRDTAMTCYTEAVAADNTLRLKVPWAGSTYRAGHPVGNCHSGGTYAYSLCVNVRPPVEWTFYRGSVAETVLGSAAANTMWPGTAFIKPLVLGNRGSAGAVVVPGAACAFSGLSLRQVQVLSPSRVWAGGVPAGSVCQVTHSLGTRDVSVQVYLGGAPYTSVQCDVERTSVDVVTLYFAVPVAAGVLRCVVTGG